MKRKITLALLLVLMLALAGCNGCNGGNTGSGLPDADTSSAVGGEDTTSTPVSNADDGVIDLDAPQADGTTTGAPTTTTTTKADGNTPPESAADTTTTTVPTAGDFDDPGNFIEVPLG